MAQIERPFRILWGPNLENALDFTFPVYGTAVYAWRTPRPGSVRVTNQAAYYSWMNGRHYRLRVTADYFDAPRNWGASGLQAFMDWAADSNTFTLVPNLYMPGLAVPGCFLEGPFLAPSPRLGQGEVQSTDLTIVHPTADLGLAWRGLWLEYAAGADVGRSFAYPGYVFNGRGGVAGFETTWSGGLRSVLGGSVSNSLRDGHFHPGGGGTWTLAGGNVASPLDPGLQTTLLELARTNLVLQNTALATSPWGTGGVGGATATNAAYVGPDGTITASRIQEGTGNGLQERFQNFASAWTAGHALAVSWWWRPGQRTKGEVILSSTQNANYIGIDWSQNSDGTLTMISAGGSTIIQAAWLGPYPGDWYFIWMVAQIDAATTTSGNLELRLLNAAGANVYTGDGVSGAYWWGAQVEDIGFAPAAVLGVYAPSSTILTTTAAVSRGHDDLRFTFYPVPQAMWYYVKFVELGATLNAASDGSRLISFGSDSTRATWIEASSGKYEAVYFSGTSVSPTGPLSATRYGDVVELLVVLDTDLTVRMNQFIRRVGVEEQSGKGAIGNPFPAQWIGNTVSLASAGGGGETILGLAQLKSGPLATLPGFQVTSMAAARYA